MTLYRIYGDDARYLNFVEDASDFEEKMGEDCIFHLDPTPRRYADEWTEPMLVDFHYGNQGRNKIVPDIAENGGRLYFSIQAYDRLHAMIDDAGEFLPVRHQDGAGYLFNPLRTAEEVDGIDRAKTVHDAHGNLVHYAFHEGRVAALPIFKTAMDVYNGIFCQGAFKSAVEGSGLTGILFGPDYSNPIGTAFGGMH